MRTAVFLGLAAAEIASISGFSKSQRCRVTATAPERGTRPYDPILLACIRAAAGLRFIALTDDDHRRERAWSRYAGRR